QARGAIAVDRPTRVDAIRLASALRFSSPCFPCTRRGRRRWDAARCGNMSMACSKDEEVAARIHATLGLASAAHAVAKLTVSSETSTHSKLRRQRFGSQARTDPGRLRAVQNTFQNLSDRSHRTVLPRGVPPQNQEWPWTETPPPSGPT